MPFTPYHFGPSGFVGLLLRKWIDFPVFMLANVVIDFEVLITHHHAYGHTLLLGAAVGVLWGLAAYPLRGVFKRLMDFVRLPYKTGRFKMIASGILGVWLHVVIDAMVHYDVRLLWPNKKFILMRLITKPLSRANMTLTYDRVELACLILLGLAAVVYIFVAISFVKAQKAAKAENHSK